MTLIQQFMRGEGSTEEKLARLKALYCISHRRHSNYENLILFKYNQIESPFAEPIVRECRGIILDESNDWQIVSWAFCKFFNEGEGHAAKIDWSTARVQEKVDGSLCVLYPWAGGWCVATSGTPDAIGEVHGAGGTFREYFWSTLGYGIDDEQNEDPQEYCFFFELSGPANRIVVVHDKPKLTLLGARRRSDWKGSASAECVSLLPWRAGRARVHTSELRTHMP